MRKGYEEDDDVGCCFGDLQLQISVNIVITRREDENIEIELNCDDERKTVAANVFYHHNSYNERKKQRQDQSPLQPESTVSSSAHPSKDHTNDMTILDILSEDVIGHILECLGPGEFRFIAGTCTAFARVYHRIYNGNSRKFIKGNKKNTKNVKDTTIATTYKTNMRNVVESVSRSQLYLIEEGNCSKTLQTLAYHSSLYGNLQVLECIMSHHSSDDIDVDSSNNPITTTTGLWNNRYAVETIRTNAAKRGHLHILKFSQDKTMYPFRKQVLHCAILLGHVDIVQWLLESGSCPHDKNTCNYAVRTDTNIDVLKCLRRYGLAWDEFTFMYAASYGSIEILQYLHEQNCPWDMMVCYQGSKHGHLNVLQWATQQNNCPWNQQLNRRAAEQNGHSNIVQWIDEYYTAETR